MGDRKKFALVCGLLFLTGIGNILIHSGVSGTEPAFPSPGLPFLKNGWRGAPHPVTVPESDGSRLVLSRTYRMYAGPPVHFLILYNTFYTHGVDSHMPSVCYRGVGWDLTESVRLSTTSGKICMAGFTGGFREDRILVYYGFLVGDRIVPDGLTRKYYEIKHRLRYGGIRHFLVEAAMVFKPGGQETAMGYIQRFIEEMEANLVGSGG